MELKEAISKRKSIRGYKTDPVSKEFLSEIIEISLRAPSAMNVQPWEITVLAGEPLNELRRIIMTKLDSGSIPVSDFGSVKPYEGVHKERQRALGLELYRLLEIDRKEKEKRLRWTMKGLRAFDAPAVIILAADENLDIRMAASDIGGLVQTICLVALDYELGTCINSQGVSFPDEVRKITGIPESKKIYLCISIGYPDWTDDANELSSERESVEKAVHWVGF
ncbi:MAG: nitroreductase [Syntrophales bacterium]|jgi:nitroreductase|nr:nitroreductase [Syntrophales bacterium]MDY0043444.1 nitroreductase [Syntrophales bacterium]